MPKVVCTLGHPSVSECHRISGVLSRYIDGRRAIWVLASAGGLSLVPAACGGDAAPSGSPAATTTADGDVAYRLAVVDGAAADPAEEDRIAPYRVALAALDERCTQSTAEEIGDQVVRSQQIVAERRGVEPSILELLQTAADPGFDVSPDCARVFTAVIFALAP